MKKRDNLIENGLVTIENKIINLKQIVNLIISI